MPWLVVGLGNPGSEYAGTYHNVGFRVLSRIAERSGIRMGIRCGPALISNAIEFGGQRTVLVMPQTFMNRSGDALGPVFERFEASIGDVIVVYDDVALPVGKIRVRRKGSAGGHNGIKSIISACGSDEFLRVRVGILPDWPIEDVRDFVLSTVARSNRALLDEAEQAAMSAVETIIADGVDKAMATFNRMDLRETKEN
jgi:peptidyl-tRNA hydrolase, PTH1 family